MKSRLLAFSGVLLIVLTAFTAPAAADDNYGAIAFSTSSGALGWSYDYSSRGGAEEEALKQCGPGCEVAIWFKNACAAIATSSNHSYGTGWASERGEAEGIAMRACRQYASDCSIARWQCTTR